MFSLFWTNGTHSFSEAEKKKNTDSLNGAPSKDETKVSKERVPSEKKAEAPKERVPSQKKTEVPKERSPSEKKKEAPKEKAPSAKEPDNVPLEKKEVPKPATLSDKIPEVKIEKRTVEESDGVSRERVSSQTKHEKAPSGGKPEVTRPPIMGVKPFSLPRDRVAAETPPRPPTAQPPRDRAPSADNVKKPSTPEEPAKPRGPPKFGIGIGGAAGGGLLAEMKLRQERAASLGRVSYPAIFRHTLVFPTIYQEK